MIYDTETRACLTIYNMAKANKCLQELETKYNYDLKGENVYKPISENSFAIAERSETVFPSKFGPAQIQNFLCKDGTSFTFKTSPF